ncbi:MAG: signal peptidase I [Candidatus Aminicenantes bacterium]|nr:signal peptidase I [Candidatus Aminicenantes bacterium]
MKKDKPKKEHSTFREYFELIAETAIFVFFVMTFVVQAFQIPTGSMERTLLVGDFLLVNKFAYARTLLPLEDVIVPGRPVKRGDIIVFRYPGDLTKDYVKRVIAVEGEKLEIKDKSVYINDSPIPEDYKVHIDNRIIPRNETYNSSDLQRDNYGPILVPEGHCFAMGDNRDNSQDSRYWGFLSLENLKGRPWMIYFSYHAEQNAYLKTGMKDRLIKFFRFVTKARWNRLFKFIK